MSTFKLILRELAGLFIDDQFLAIAILAVVLLCAGLAFAANAPPLITGTTLLIGCISVLARSVLRAKGRWGYGA